MYRSSGVGVVDFDVSLLAPLMLKSRGEIFFQRVKQHHILVSRTVKTQKIVQIAVISNETFYGNGNFYKDLLFVYLQV